MHTPTAFAIMLATQISAVRSHNSHFAVDVFGGILFRSTAQAAGSQNGQLTTVTPTITCATAMIAAAMSLYFYNACNAHSRVTSAGSSTASHAATASRYLQRPDGVTGNATYMHVTMPRGQHQVAVLRCRTRTSIGSRHKAGNCKAQKLLKATQLQCCTMTVLSRSEHIFDVLHTTPPSEGHNTADF